MTKKSVTMSDIAKVMNVSTVTVSKALGDRDGVSVELHERIKQKLLKWATVYMQVPTVRRTA